MLFLLTQENFKESFQEFFPVFILLENPNILAVVLFEGLLQYE
jgi:hypothetical protein